MASVKKLFRSFLKLILPAVLVLVVAGIATSVWLAKVSSKPAQTQYLVTPEKYARLSTRGAKITDESWTNPDNTPAKGWLLRGGENKPAVVLLHRYGTDRSWVMNLGVKINEDTNFTVLMPEQRGHGENGGEGTSTTFGVCEATDLAAATKYLRDLKNGNNALVGQNIGVYGIEMGAYAALAGADSIPEIKTIVLDSVPLTADDVVGAAVKSRFPFAGSITALLAQKGNKLYHTSCSQSDSLCKLSENLSGRKILLLSGADAPQWKESTAQLGACLPKQNKVEMNLDLALTGFNINTAKPEEADLYDQRIIDFFRINLQ
jgi:pimeloyl-ACP methyl ester carboxylesterase